MSEIPAAKEQMFYGFPFLILIVGTKAHMHLLNHGSSMVKESMIKELPKHDFVFIEDQHTPNFLPKSDPSSGAELHSPPIVKPIKISSRSG